MKFRSKIHARLTALMLVVLSLPVCNLAVLGVRFAFLFYFSSIVFSVICAVWSL
jgi:hypothetical protein